MDGFWRKPGLLTLLGILGFFIGCAGTFRSKKPLPLIRPEVLVQKIQDHASRLRTFSGQGRVMVVSSEGGFRGSIIVSFKMPDSLYMKVEGPLGMDVMTSLIASEQVLLYYPRENLAYSGSIEQMWERELLPLDMGSSVMALGILGLLILDEAKSDSLISYSSDSNKYMLYFEDGEDVWVEPKGPVVTRWEKRDGHGAILWTWEGSKFKVNKDIRLPRIIRMTSYQPKQRVTFFFETIRTNQPLKDGWCNVRIPDGVEYVEL